MKVTDPHTMNETFAQAFNSRNLDNVLALYEPGALLRVGPGDRTLTGSSLWPTNSARCCRPRAR